MGALHAGRAAAGATPRRAELGHEGWQLSATWFLTDEDATYRGLPRPNQPFVLGGDGWGASSWSIASVRWWPTPMLSRFFPNP